MDLAATTSTRWAEMALADPQALLNDHAHLERKAASNAMDLIGRWPEQPGSATRIWVERLSGIDTGHAELLEWIDAWLTEKEEGR